MPTLRELEERAYRAILFADTDCLAPYVVGDDIPDLQVMLAAGLAVGVADAHALVRKHAHWVTPSAGGQGAAREVCEFVLDAQNRLQELYRRYVR